MKNIVGVEQLPDVELTGEGIDSVMGTGKKSSEVSLSDSRLVEATVLILILSTFL